MSNDDTESHVARLYDDGLPDDADCDEGFMEGKRILFNQMEESAGKVSKPVGSDESFRPALAALSQVAAEATRMPPTTVPNVAPPVRAAGQTPIVASVDTISSSQQVRAGRGQQLRGQRAHPGTPGLPPPASRPLSPHQSTIPLQQPPIPSPPAVNAQNNNSRQSFGEKRKKAPLLVTSYFVASWMYGCPSLTTKTP